MTWTELRERLRTSRIIEATTWAGVGVGAQAVATLITSQGRDMSAWVSLVGSLVAILKREAGNVLVRSA